MTNYGHDIRFGLEILGAGDVPRAGAALAVLAEEHGYDFVTFPDPVDGTGPEAGSLAAWTAARTTSVHVGAFWNQRTARPASVVARGAASLQLLSRGRGMLLFAAGTTPEELDAVEQAVAVARALQDTSRGRVSLPGTHDALVGAEPGPALEHELPLWLAGSGRMAADLAGRVADGWLVSLDDVDVGQLADLSAVLDRAATRAGRDAREIRRAATVRSGTGLDVEALVALALDHGVSALVLRSEADDASQVREFIDEVAPAVRAGVERALPPDALSLRPLRRADVRARRRPGIAYDTIPEALAQTAVEPGDSAFGKVRSTYLRGGNPGLVLRPHTVTEVTHAVGFAREHMHLPLGIRSGGHGISGRSTNDGGLVIDVGAFDEITVLGEAARLVRIGPGARWRDVARVLQPFGWALSSGDYGGVGVGGLATAGGVGFLARRHGLTIDHLHAIEMVLADGTHVRASETENPELFWAARGAGSNFGVAVAFEFVVDQVDDVGWAELGFQVPDPAAYLEAFGRVVANTPRETTPFLILGRDSARLMAMVASADPDVVISQLQPFAQIAPVVQQQVVIAPYAAVMNMFPATQHNGRGEPVSRSALTREITPGFASASAELIHSGASHWYQIRTVGGAVGDVDPDATA